MEGAARGESCGVGWLAADHGSLAQAIGGVRLGHRGQERPAVGVLGVLDELAGRCHFHDATRVHDRDAVGEVACAGQVVGDVQECQLLLGLQVLEQVQDLSATRGVDHRDRLVGHQVVRLQDHGPGDADALALPARERVGVLLGELRGWRELDLFEGRQHPGLSLAA